MMSRGGTGGNLGSAQFRLEANDAEFAAGMSRAKNAAQGFSGQIASELNTAIGSVRALTQAWTRFVGTLGAVGSAVALVSAPLVLLKRQSDEAREAATALRKALNELEQDTKNKERNSRLTAEQIEREKAYAAVAEESVKAYAQVNATSRLTQKERELAIRTIDELIDRQYKLLDQRFADEDFRERIKQYEELSNAANKLAEEERQNEERWAQIQADNHQKQLDYMEELGRIEEKRQRERLELLREQTRELQRQLQLFDDIQGAQTGGGFSSLTLSLDAIHREVRSIRGVIR